MKSSSGHFWLIAFGVLILYLLYSLFENIQIRTSHKVATGIITKVDYEPMDAGGVLRIVYYEFWVGNKKYENSSTNQRGDEGDPITVYYASNNPEFNTTHKALGESGFRFFLDWFLFIGGTVGFIFYIRWCIRKFWKGEKNLS
ncbi:MAG: hypothetical protein AB1631_01800 [Acidobacteriota bacterium]